MTPPLFTEPPPASEDRPGQDGTAGEPPRADCVADSAGGLTFDLADPGTGGPAHLLLARRTKEEHTTDEVRLPLTEAGTGRLRAALPSSVPLVEGRWDAYLLLPSARPRKLAPGLNDLRSLVDRVPSAWRSHVSVRIPYTTGNGRLAVRTWRRSPHAEAGELHVTGGGVRVTGRVHLAELSAGACAELRGRHSSAPVLRLELDADGPEFTFTVPYEQLAAAAPAGIWDVYLRPAGPDGPRAKVARLLDDVADKKHIFTYPATPLAPTTGPRSAQPYYTLSNDLSIRIEPA
ncbi:hypothetical protein [Streptomyces sp. NPDC058045]|uniref:hypothetical protein n=1 Tax=Streptomyces sp. NPDC058045 TaxID=3346311 RepID=UPI0036E185A0